MIRVQANLFRIASMCVTSDKTRFYLQGVYIEPHHHMGVTLTATDGHRLLCIHDDIGVCDQAAIVRLSPDALRACKPAKGDPSYATRMVSIGDRDKRAFVVLETAEPPFAEVAVSPDCLVDGAFPDWRSVVASNLGPQEGEAKLSSYNQAYVASFCDIARELAAGRDKTPGIIMTGGHHGNAALVQFPGCDHAFGLLMPMRLPSDFRAAVAPYWFAAKAPTAIAA